MSDHTAAEMLQFVKEHGLKGVVASVSTAPTNRLWSKHRVYLGHESMIGGYTPGSHGIDSIVVGFYRGKLIYASRVRAGFVPGTRRTVFEKIKDLKISLCPFANLQEPSAGRWGQGLTADKMKECIWVRPETVARIDLLDLEDVFFLPDDGIREQWDTGTCGGCGTNLPGLVRSIHSPWMERTRRWAQAATTSR